jgi:hypothetical protein
LGTGVNFIFKGSGFYQTEYRSNEYKKQASAESPTSGSKGAKAETQTETKKETKAPVSSLGASVTTAPEKKETTIPASSVGGTAIDKGVK